MTGWEIVAGLVLGGAALFALIICAAGGRADDRLEAMSARRDADMELLRRRGDQEWAQAERAIERSGFSELDVEWLHDHGVAA